MFIYWAFCTFLAFIIKGLAGFANSMFFGTLLSFKTDNINISPVDLLLSFPSNSILLWHERKHLKKNVWLPLSILVVCGSVPGAIWLKVGDSKTVKLIFGIVVVLIAVEMLLRERSTKKQKSSKIALAIIGVISGVCSGLYGIGAMLAAYVSRTTDNVREFRANICLVFLIENVFRVGIYIYTGIIDFTAVKTAVCVIPFMLLGMFVGVMISRHTSEKMVKKIIIFLLILSGLSLIITNLF